MNNYPKMSHCNLNNKKLIRINHLIIGFLVLMFCLSSCRMSNSSMTPSNTLAEPTLMLTTTSYRNTATNTPKSTTTWMEFAEEEINFYQKPVLVKADNPSNSVYIFKSAIVTFITPAWEGKNFLNLDNLYDSQPTNGDIVISHTTGSGGTFYELSPANGATYYYSDLHQMNYDSCLEHFPFTRMDHLYYSLQGMRIDSGRDYCILTDEGHLSIIRMFPDSLKEYSDDYQEAYPEIVVTTYSKIVSQALTPYPTETPELTITPDKYAGMNLTTKQKEGLDKAAQDLIDAVIADDRKTVISLLDFPVTIDRETLRWPTYVKNEEDFLSIYGEIFTPEVINELHGASVDKNMGIHHSFISLLLPDCLIMFHPDGRIAEFSLSSIWWTN